MSFEARIERVRARAEDAGVDALLVTNLTNVRYLTGFSGTNGQVLVGRDGAVFMSDPRYAARASDLVQGAEVLIYPARLTDVLVERLARAEVQRLGIEAKTMTVAARDELAAKLGGPGGRRARTPNPREELGGPGGRRARTPNPREELGGPGGRRPRTPNAGEEGAVEVVSTSAIVEDERRSKDAAEVALMREAARLADDAFEWILDRLTPGRTETEIALDLEMRVRRQGADDVSFDPIVGTGSLSAHIHHTPSGRALQRGDLVLLDFGAQVDGYCSDLTRTVILGEASEEHRSLYTRLLEAQAAGIAALEPGATGAEVDRTARSVVDAAGDGDSFGHGLGHGVGLDIHEAPRLHWESRDTLAVGDVVTVEPGVYRVGWGGMRIEDCVLVTETGCEVLSSAPKKELIEL